MEVHTEYLLLQFPKVLTHKGQSLHHHLVKNYPQAPYINPKVIINLVQEELQCLIRERATECDQRMANIFATKAKVC